MNNPLQMTLSPVRTLYRSSDPHTSGAAADGHDASGGRLRHADLVMAAVVAGRGMTAAEYGSLTGLGHIEAQRRLSDLEHAHRVRKGAARECREKGTRMVTWFPVSVAGEGVWP